MLVERIWAANPLRNFNYLIACEETGEAFNPNLSKAEASEQIEALKLRSPRLQEHP